MKEPIDWQKVFEPFRGCVLVPEIRKRLLVTLGILALYRTCLLLPLPYLGDLVHIYGTASPSQQMAWTGRTSVFCLGTMPITATAVLLLALAIFLPQVRRRIAPDDSPHAGLRPIFLLFFIPLVAYQAWLNAESLRVQAAELGTYLSGTSKLLLAVLMVAASCIALWMTRIIRAHGIGDGVAFFMVMFAGIHIRVLLPRLTLETGNPYSRSPDSYAPVSHFQLGAGIAELLITVAVAVAVQQAFVRLRSRRNATDDSGLIGEAPADTTLVKLDYGGAMAMAVGGWLLVIPQWILFRTTDEQKALGLLFEPGWLAMAAILTGIGWFIVNLFLCQSVPDSIESATVNTQSCDSEEGLPRKSDEAHTIMWALAIGAVCFILLMLCRSGMWSLVHQVQWLNLSLSLFITAAILDAVRHLDRLLAEHGYRGFLPAFNLDSFSSVDSWIKWMPW